jgi:Carboxypeptidase regulatory-like domain/TonB-dependent Receptor Plug Domain
MRRLLPCVWVAVSLVVPVGMRAQTGAVRGVVWDSIVGAPLAGAEVWLEGVERTAITDRAGVFRIDSLAPGAYTITFGHPSLDSLGLGAPFGTVAVRAAETVDVRLTTPSMLGMARTLCPAVVADSVGVVLGVVRDAAAGTPLPGARVTVSWGEWSVRGNTVDRRDRVIADSTDRAGRYVVCGVPNDVVVGVHAREASDSSRATGRVLVDVRGRVLTWRDLALGAPAATDARGGAVSLVVVDERGHPVAGAQARVGATGDFRPTSDDGRLRIGGLPTGTRSLEVRAIGYRSTTVSVDLAPGREVARTVELRKSPAPLLETVRIIGARPYRDVTGFEERRKHGFGYYMTNAEIERHTPFRFTDLMRRFPGVSVVVPRGAGPLQVVSTRSTIGPFGSAGVQRQCPLAVYVDDIPIGGDDLDAAINPYFIRGIEVYPGSAGVPPKYGASACGTVLVWTR